MMAREPAGTLYACIYDCMYVYQEYGGAPACRYIIYICKRIYICTHAYTYMCACMCIYVNICQ